MSLRKTIRTGMKAALMALLSISASPAFAAGHHGLGGMDDGFEGSARVMDSELSSIRGGSININGTNITLTIAQNLTTYNTVTNVTNTQQFFFSNTGIQPSNLTQVANVATQPSIIQGNLTQTVITATQTISAMVQTSFDAATFSRISNSAIYSSILAAHH